MRRYVNCFQDIKNPVKSTLPFTRSEDGKVDGAYRNKNRSNSDFLSFASEIQQFLVARNIFCGGNVPREVHTHDFFDKLRPFFRIFVKQFRFSDHMEHIMSIICGERETVTASVKAIRLDGIEKTARFAHDRYCAVAGSDHLRKSASLALGRHEEDIRARINQLGKSAVISKIYGSSAGITLCGIGKERQCRNF